MIEYPTVAVLMSFYRKDNLALFELALESIKNQEYPGEKIRIYLGVDGPVPESHEQILLKHQQSFYKIVRLEKNQGLAKALNHLLDAVENEEYLFRMDGDDLCHSKRFITQVDFLESNPAIDLVGSDAVDIDENGAELNTRVYPVEHSAIMSALYKLNPILHPTYCIRGASMRRDRIRYPDDYLTEDWAFLFLAARYKWRFHNISTPLLKWRTGADFYKRRSNFRRGWQEYCTASRGIYRIYGISKKLIWPFGRFIFRLLPSALVQPIYTSGLRNKILKK